MTVLDDAHDEGEETLTLRLSNASGSQVADGEATGTIEPPRTPAGEIRCPCLRSSLLTRSWPNAGCSNANRTIASSISGAVRFCRFGFRRDFSIRASTPSSTACWYR